jgi:hypothetical protein
MSRPALSSSDDKAEARGFTREDHAQLANTQRSEAKPPRETSDDQRDIGPAYTTDLYYSIL